LLTKFDFGHSIHCSGSCSDRLIRYNIHRPRPAGQNRSHESCQSCGYAVFICRPPLRHREGWCDLYIWL
jgi:hypothetical protein